MLSTKNTTIASEFHLKDKAGKKDKQSDILPVDEDLAWHHSSAATALWSGGFDVQRIAEVYVETKNITSRVIRINYHLLFTKENILNTDSVSDVINAHFQKNASYLTPPLRLTRPQSSLLSPNFKY